MTMPDMMDIQFSWEIELKFLNRVKLQCWHHIYISLINSVHLFILSLKITENFHDLVGHRTLVNKRETVQPKAGYLAGLVVKAPVTYSIRIGSPSHYSKRMAPDITFTVY